MLIACYIDHDIKTFWTRHANTGLVSVPFHPLLTGVWVRIVELFKWAGIGETIFHGQFFIGGGSK